MIKENFEKYDIMAVSCILQLWILVGFAANLTLLEISKENTSNLKQLVNIIVIGTCMMEKVFKFRNLVYVYTHKISVRTTANFKFYFKVTTHY